MIHRRRLSMLDGSHSQACLRCGPGYAHHPTWREGWNKVCVSRFMHVIKIHIPIADWIRAVVQGTLCRMPQSLDETEFT